MDQTVGNSVFRRTKIFLLTGTGFTKGFGGYLGSAMWPAILSQPELQNIFTEKRWANRS
jgi:hypothetical protein